MKSLKQLAAITLFGAAACAGLYAQTADLRAIIPFDFKVGQASMPAGDYDIHEQGGMVSVRRIDDGKPANAVVTTVGGEGTGRNGSPILQFHRYGDEYFLAAVRNPALGGGRVVPPTVREKEVAKRFGIAAEATVIARKR
jgi:hypothetical protein